MYMGEEEAFWALSALMADPKYCMHGEYFYVLIGPCFIF